MGVRPRDRNSIVLVLRASSGGTLKIMVNLELTAWFEVFSSR